MGTCYDGKLCVGESLQPRFATYSNYPDMTHTYRMQAQLLIAGYCWLSHRSLSKKLSSHCCRKQRVENCEILLKFSSSVGLHSAAKMTCIAALSFWDVSYMWSRIAGCNLLMRYWGCLQWPDSALDFRDTKTWVHGSSQILAVSNLLCRSILHLNFPCCIQESCSLAESKCIMSQYSISNLRQPLVFFSSTFPDFWTCFSKHHTKNREPVKRWPEFAVLKLIQLECGWGVERGGCVLRDCWGQGAWNGLKTFSGWSSSWLEHLEWGRIVELI